jgi:hypothetical protein
MVPLGHESHTQLEKEVRACAASHDADPRKAMHNLWQALVEEALFNRAAGGSSGLRRAEILLAFLFKLKAQGSKIAQDVPQPGAEAQEEVLRILRLQASQPEAAPCPSRQRGLDGQPTGEPANALLELSQVLARYSRQTGVEASWADACSGFPLSPRLPGRVGLLRGAGNAVVPQVAAEVVKAYLETHP